MERAIALLKKFESFSPTAYRDGGAWSIGYGCQRINGVPVLAGDTITRSQAETELRREVVATIQRLAIMPGWGSLSDGQRVALISFSYNTGWYLGHPQFQSFNRMMRDRSYQDAARVFGLYVKSGNEPLPGLVTRRAEESAIFMEGMTMGTGTGTGIAIALRDTWLKQSTVQAEMLGDEFKVRIKKGQAIAYTEWKPWKSGHIQIKLTAPVEGKTTWLAFDQDVQFPDEDKEIWLNVPYYSQRDNASSEWWRQCNSSSHAMILNFIKPGSVASDDDYIRRFVDPVGDTTDWGVHTQALRRFGIESVYRQNLGVEDLERSLKAGYPVAIGVYHKGSLDAPSGGHVLVICGMKPGAFLGQDPWGRPFSYSDHNGRKVEIPISPSLERRWLTDGDNAGWGRLITAVDGKRTGL